MARWSALVLGMAPLVAAMFGPAWGLVGDRHGRKIVVQCSLMGFSVFLGLVSLSQNVWHLVATRGLLGIFGGFTALSLAMITTAVPRERLGQAVGLQQSAQILALAVAPAIGGLIAHQFGLRLTFVVAALLCLVALLIASALYREPASESRASEKRGKPTLRGALKLRNSFLSVAAHYFVAIALVSTASAFQGRDQRT